MATATSKLNLDPTLLQKMREEKFQFSDGVTIGRLPSHPNNSTPAVITPQKAECAAKEFLLEFCRVNRVALLTLMTARGAVLFRGFNVDKAQDFEDIILQIEPNLSAEYLGTSPRVPVTKYVFTASELPNFYPIPEHLEMSFLPCMPEKLFFFCEQPTQAGGATPLCDFAAVARDLPADLAARFRERGVRYVRNYTGPKEWTLDPSQLKSWTDIYGTEDKAVVESTSKRDSLRVEWKKNDGLRLQNEMPAFAKHPVSGEEVWHNHSQVFHPATAHQEFFRIARKTGWLRFYLWALFAWVLFVVKWLSVKSESDKTLNTLYGDGSVISLQEMAVVRDTVWKHMVCEEWQRSDFVMIDNQRVAHGRLPYIDLPGKKRKVLVSWG